MTPEKIATFSIVFAFAHKRANVCCVVVFNPTTGVEMFTSVAQEIVAFVSGRKSPRKFRAEVAEADAIAEANAKFLASMTEDERAAWWSAGLKADVMQSANYCASCDTIHTCHCH